jgi:hypothetical protein
MKKGFVLVAVALTLSACGSNVAGPTPSPSPIVSFAGTWSGTYTVTACGNNGDFKAIDFCSTFSKGTVLPVTLTLTQNGSSVSGTLSQHDVHTPVTGSVGGTGHLSLSGSASVDGFTIETVGWDTVVSSGTLTGGWADKFTKPSLAGFAQFSNQLNSVLKSSAGAATTSALKAGRSNGTLQDVFDAMKE